MGCRRRLASLAHPDGYPARAIGHGLPQLVGHLPYGAPPTNAGSLATPTSLSRISCSTITLSSVLSGALPAAATPPLPVIGVRVTSSCTSSEWSPQWSAPPTLPSPSTAASARPPVTEAQCSAARVWRRRSLAIPNKEPRLRGNSDVADGMPWKFTPTQREVRVKPGESALAFYTAKNHSSTPITGVSTYNVTPMNAAVYFNKIQCFCLEEQLLLPGEQIDMPVFFHVDPECEADPKMDGVNNLILSYTFKVNEG
ncbi:hypothetical protein OPV22_013866 [Ensete ventricosum]|uniref:Cytochrome c oxidase assembly protein CtaG n=1 Tax=Ensete ventricosum TaxID=4639 RepID=A0AAV8R9A1_ENSVE|nr:hypothetical protein OPV22_013866 [Ensete ventricosum]